MPVVISSGLGLAEADAEIPLSHPRILYDDVFSAGTLTASTEATDFEKENAVDWNTFDSWKPTALPAMLDVLLDEARPVDCAMLGVHSLGTYGAAARFYYHDGVDWVALTNEVAPGSDRVLAFLFEEVTSNRFRLRLTGAGSAPEVGVCIAGQALRLERGMMLQHTPLRFARKTIITPNEAETGPNFLGRSQKRYGIEGQIKIANLTADYVRDDFEPFIVHARSKPFGFIESPVAYSDDVFYLQTVDDIRPMHDGLPDRMNVEFAVKGRA